MAYYGSFGEINYSNLSTSTADSAIDIFVYDTRKDSDGGDWRYKINHTSWYNETLNTATRGARREFPSVGILVLQADTLTIYDGDDPDLPMWMKFTGSSILYSSSEISVCMLNGLLCVGNNFATGVKLINFISDRVIGYRTTAATTYQGNWKSNIEGRNLPSSTWDGVAFSPTIISGIVNDIAMTVLPNAPIDNATGLPVPTIIVGTPSGTSIIKDNGQVSNITASIYGSGYWYGVSIFDKKYFVTGASNDYTRVGIANLETNTHAFFVTSPNIPGDYIVNLGWGTKTAPLDGGFALGGIYGANLFRQSGLCLIQPNYTSPSTSMHTHITSTYNTGYQVGNIKGAWLSDTSTTAASSTSLVTGDSSTFTSGTGNWSAAYQSTIAATGGQLVMTASGGTNPYASLSVTVVSGKQYRVDIRPISKTFSTNFQMWLGRTSGLAKQEYGIIELNDFGNIMSMYFTATSSLLNVQVIGNGSTTGQQGIFDDFTVYELESDRSISEKGLQAIGTITKSVVATGSNLVSYSAGGTSNYLQQPHDSLLNFGTGDFSIMGWIKTQFVGGGQYIFNKSTNTTLREFELWVAADLGYMAMWLGGGDMYSPNAVLNQETWTHFCAFRRSGIAEIYINGVSVVSKALPSTVNTSNPARIAYDFNSGTKLSLLRISATAPSPEQIKKIYNDEKILFQENTTCTLYGSDVVSSLAYDDTTKLLHVGTNSGRSDFQGLARINNTTTAVTTAISASNGLVAEQ